MKYAFFKGEIVDFSQAKISVMTHAFNYGTGVFEGIRGYWNPQQKKTCVLKLREHFVRLLNSAKIMKMEIKYSLAELGEITVKLIEKNAYQENIYIRPIIYKSQEKIGLGLSGIADDLTIYLAPFGEYLDISKGIKVCVSSWQRIDDNIIPARAKVTGLYVNSSLAKSEALDNGYAEAILLTREGHVAEGSGENIFMLREGKLITPPVYENTLEGITRGCIKELAEKELGLQVEERPIDRTELYIADELFFCGTGAQVSPIIEVDKRKIASGKVGAVTAKLQKIYFEAAKGNNPKYSDWVTSV